MKDILNRLRKFRDDRDWSQFHTPENLATSIIIEAAELLENYQWPGFIDTDLDNVKEEIADILAYTFLLADHYGFDIKAIMNEKINKNEQKYPVEKAKGKSTKYDKL